MLIIKCIDIYTNKKSVYSAKNIFLCCGPISTAALLFRSNLVKDKKVVFRSLFLSYF